MLRKSMFRYLRPSLSLALGASLALPGLALSRPALAWQDPSTAEPLPTDILDRLSAIEGLRVQEEETQLAEQGYRRFQLYFTQPIDHNNPQAGTFEQSLILHHYQDGDAPMILNTQGYGFFPFDYILPLTYQLQGNSLAVEHRFFGASVPEPRDDRFLTIEQAAADHHRIVQALKPLYQKPWISTGSSKGGMTAIYFRRFYPSDVDATVAFVAPNSFGRADLRYPFFLSQVGTEECRAKINEIQRRLLRNKTQFAAQMRDRALETGGTFNLVPGGISQAFEYAVGESAYAFWQYKSVDDCVSVPGQDASDSEIFDFFWSLRSWSVLSDQDYARYNSYYIQAVRQLGYPALDFGPFWWLLSENPNDYAPYLNGAEKGEFDQSSMVDIYLWNAFASKNMMLIYGENDPWTAGSFHFFGRKGRDVHRFDVPGGNHGAQVSSLDPEVKAQAVEVLERWSGSTFRPLPRRSEAGGYAASTGLYPTIDFPIEAVDERFFEPGASLGTEGFSFK